MESFKKKFLHYFLYLKFIIFFINLSQIFSDECPYNNPFLFEDECTTGICSLDYIETAICTINNEIVKTQWFNNIIYFSDFSTIIFDYIDIYANSNGNLFLLASCLDSSIYDKRIIYILKNDGSEYFTTENPVLLFDNLSSKKEHGNIFTIQLNNTIDNKEYLISISPNNTFELYDIDENYVYEKSMNQLFDIDYFYQNTSAFLELEDYYYCLGMIGSFESSSYLFIYKLSFKSKDITEFSPIISYQKFSSSKEGMVSCYKTDLQYILCFYKTVTYNYSVIAFQQNLEMISSFTFSSQQKENYFFKCVHYYEEVGAFAYFDSDGLLTLEFKELTSSYQLQNYYSKRDYLKTIIETKNYSGERNDIIQLDDKKLCFVTSYSDYFYLIIFNDYKEGEIKIRKYTFDIYNLYLYAFDSKISITLYNNFIAVASGYSQMKSIDNDILEESSSLIIFSYANSIDFEIDITDYLKSYQDIIIDFNKNCNIDNNIFGLVPNGIKIINFEEEFKLLSSKNNRILKIGDSISTNENITLNLYGNITIPKNRKIKYAMIVTEPDYDTYQKYVTTTICDCEEDQEKNGYFIKKNYTGKHSYCNIKINENEITNQCLDDNCNLCLQKNNSICVLCKNEAIKLEEGSITCLLPETTYIQTSLPETTYIQTTLPETTIPKTKLPETTIPKITYIQTTLLETTIPKTTYMQTKLPETTIIKTTYIQTKLPETTYIETTLTVTTFIDNIYITTVLIDSKIIETTEIETSYDKTALVDSTNIESSIPKSTYNQIFPSQTITIGTIIENESYIKDTSTIIGTFPEKTFTNENMSLISSLFYAVEEYEQNEQ